MNVVVTSCHHWPSIGAIRARSVSLSGPALTITDRITAVTTSRIVLQGRASPRMPGISPGRSGARRGRGRLRRAERGGFGTPPFSSLGARFRRRVPQYGHSVMYGDTSARQFLQTTKRSGPLDMGYRFYAERKGGPLRRCCGDDLAHDLVEVVVGLEDHPLARRAVSALDDVLEPVELLLGAEILRVRP